MPKTILVADDSVTIRKVVELTFHDTDIRVESTGSGREAMDRIAAVRPDLVLADVIMPEPSGYEICRSIKASEHPVPVLLLAGAFEPFDPERARDCGADGHVVKPFESRALLERVEALLDRRVKASAQEPPVTPVVEEVEALLDELAGAPRSGEPAPVLRLASAPQEALDWLLGPEAAKPAPEPIAPIGRLSAEELDAIVRAVLEALSERVVREIVWKVVPDLAESIIRERIRQLEQADPEKT